MFGKAPLIVLLPREVLTSIATERSRHLPNETGGFLIGTRRGPHVEVTGLTVQGPGDAATRTTFARLCPSHRERIHRAWRRSGAMETMVGDWHTHPIGSSQPSGTDRSAWQALLRSTGLPMIGLIDAGAPSPGLYVAARGDRPVGIELALVAEDDRALCFQRPSGPPVGRFSSPAPLPLRFRSAGRGRQGQGRGDEG